MAKELKLNLKDRDSIIIVKINDAEGNETGNTLRFDLEDINQPIRYQELIEADKKNRQWLNNQRIIINKRQDVKGKKMMSKNEEDLMKSVEEFYQKEMDALDLFLGKDGCKKMLNGANPYLEMFDDIMETLEPVLKEMDLGIKNLDKKIKEKYKNKEENVLE